MVAALLVAILASILFPKAMRFVVILVLFGLVYLFANSAHAIEMSPYRKGGIVRCSLPGTTINFALNGQGGAVVTDSSSDFIEFRKASRFKTWSANTILKDGQKLLVLDNLHSTRIMIGIPGDKGVIFVTDKGVSDVVCQVLVDAE